MLKRELAVQNKSGLHARPASELVRKASSFKSNILVEYKDKSINAKSIVGLLSAAIPRDSKIVLVVEGVDEEEAMEAISELIEKDYEE